MGEYDAVHAQLQHRTGMVNTTADPIILLNFMLQNTGILGETPVLFKEWGCRKIRSCWSCLPALVVGPGALTAHCPWALI